MNIILWVVFGAVVGWIASMIAKSDSDQGFLGDVILGVVGAVVGGFIMNVLGQPGVTGFDVYSIVVALIGAVVVVFAGRALMGGRSTM